jgi:hypothetical protein
MAKKAESEWFYKAVIFLNTIFKLVFVLEIRQLWAFGRFYFSCLAYQRRTDALEGFYYTL